MDKQLREISIDGNTFYIFTNMPISFDKFSDTSICREDFFEVSLFNGKEVYSGKVYTADILKMCSVVDMEKDSFYDSLRQCLSNAGCSSSQFTYHIMENNDSSLQFIWKQILDEEMKFQLGSMLLRLDENTQLKTLDIFAFLSQNLYNLSEKVTNLSSKNRNLEAEKSEMAKRLDGYVLTKESLEKELFTKFSLVLNEKKARIRELMKSDKDCNKSKETVENTKREESSGGETDTDEEKEKVVEKAKKVDTVKKTNKKDNKLGIILDESIPDDDEDVPRKNRKRVRTTKPKSPVQPILPRSSSLLKPPKQPSPPTTNEEEVKQKETQEEDLLDQLMF